MVGASNFPPSQILSAQSKSSCYESSFLCPLVSQCRLQHATEDGKLLALHLQKHYAMDWWHIVLEGEPEIDVTKVNLPNASLSDLHPDTRRHIEHVMVWFFHLPTFKYLNFSRYGLLWWLAMLSDYTRAEAYPGMYCSGSNGSIFL